MDKDFDLLLGEVWGERIKEYLDTPPMFITKKTKNKKWIWYKFWIKRYNYKDVINPKWKKIQKLSNVDIKKAIKILK